MKAIARVSLIWFTLFAVAVLWAVIDRRSLNLSDTWSIYIPAAIIFVILFLAVHRAPRLNISRGAHALATTGIAIVLTLVLLWLWFIACWGLFGGSAP